MPASVYEPIASVLRNSFHGPKSSNSNGLNSKMDSSLQKSLLVPVQYDDPVRQAPNLSEKQKSKYIILTASNRPTPADADKSADNGNGVAKSVGKLDQVPDPRVTLFRREQVELGYRCQAGPGSGMFNMGNTCYLNSTLQALFHTPAFVNYLRFGGHENTCGSNGFSSCTICIMAATLRGTNSQSPMKPIKIYEKLKLICKHLVHGRQEDAHEFLRYLIESLQRSYLISRKIPKNIDNYTKETTPFNQIFGGYMRQDVTCLRCKHVSTTFQHFMDLLLDIRQADHIDTALAGYFRRENLGQGENMYKCEKCHQKVPATKQYKIERPPLVLCVQLKRFNMMGGKNGRPVTLARKLNITNHVRWAASKNIAIEYRLVSMINHVGPSPNCGHYTSIAEAANGTFYRFDDSCVNPTSLQNALNTSAYVIFYEMLKTTRNQIVNSSNNKTETVKSKIDQSVTSPAPERKIIGPQLPGPNIAKIPPSPRTIPSSSPVASSKPTQGLLVKPKVISSSPVLKKPVNTAPAVKVGGLVPYDGDSDSDEDQAKKPNSKSPTPVTQKPLMKTNVDQKLSSTPSVSTTSPFLPRAVNLKKLKDSVNKEDSMSLNLPNGNKPVAKVPVSSENKLEPNRDPSSEILYAKNDKKLLKEDSKTVTSQSRNEFHVRDIDSHSPSVHSDNSSGSTTSFTVSDAAAGVRNNAPSDNFLSTSRQKWNVVSQQTNGVTHPKSEACKRERSSPPKGAINNDEDDNDTNSEAGLQGSPKKRKKTSLFENGGNILEKAAEIGKEFLTAGAKLFKAKVGKDGDDLDSNIDTGTNCEATTSLVHDKASSSKIQSSDSNEEERKKKHKKKKKKKHKEEREESDSWVEKTKDNLENFKGKEIHEDEVKEEIKDNCKMSQHNPDAPVKSWDSKPDLKNIGRSVTWDGSKGSNIADLLRKGSEIRSWSGDRSKDLERKNMEPRKRSAAQELDAELDAGRVKKVKKFKDDERSSKWNDKNPFQMAQEYRNKGEEIKEQREFQRRHSDSFSRFDKTKRHSDHGADRQRFNSSSGGNRHHRYSDGPNNRDYNRSYSNNRDQKHHYNRDNRHSHSSYDRYKGSHHHHNYRK